MKQKIKRLKKYLKIMKIKILKMKLLLLIMLKIQMMIILSFLLYKKKIIKIDFLF